MQILIPAGILIAISLTALASLSMSFFYQQLGAIAVGLVMLVFIRRVDWRSILYSKWFAPTMYGVALILILAVLTVGPTIRNVKSWLVFGPIRFQPAELMKAALIFSYSLYFSRRHLAIARWKIIIYSFLLAFIPSVLVAKGPDLGSAVIMMGIWFGILSISGLPRRRFFVLMAAIVLSAGVMWQWGFEGYQKERIVGLIFPERDSLGVNYNVIQSKIAIGSGGLLGKGLGQGTQAQLGFLPVPESDFILSVVAEEWGFLGVVVLLVSFLWLVGEVVRAGIESDGNIEKFLCLGFAVMLILNFSLNAGSAAGLLPVVGVTFPFVSLGGSSMVVNMLLFSFVHAISKRN